VTARLNDVAINQVIDKMVSYALASGRFDSVNGHEPKSAPTSGITCAFWFQTIKPAKSGLASTSATIIYMARIYIKFNQQPFDAIDPQAAAATADLMGAFSADFDFGGAADVRAVDLLGMEGTPMQGNAGYIEIDRVMYRCITITIPIIVNDAFIQVA
jgi:hypothetical protein